MLLVVEQETHLAVVVTVPCCWFFSQRRQRPSSVCARYSDGLNLNPNASPANHNLNPTKLNSPHVGPGQSPLSSLSLQILVII